MSESLNSGPLPGAGIDCRVQRMALALRYHYSSIDRPALKSKSHLVVQVIVSGSGDHEIYVCLLWSLGYVCVCVCVRGYKMNLFLCLWCFQRLLFVSSLIVSLSLFFYPFLNTPLISSFSLSSPSTVSIDKGQKWFQFMFHVLKQVTTYSRNSGPPLQLVYTNRVFFVSLVLLTGPLTFTYC